MIHGSPFKRHYGRNKSSFFHIEDHMVRSPAKKKMKTEESNNNLDLQSYMSLRRGSAHTLVPGTSSRLK